MILEDFGKITEKLWKLQKYENCGKIAVISPPPPRWQRGGAPGETSAEARTAARQTMPARRGAEGGRWGAAGASRGSAIGSLRRGAEGLS